jgi:hypothetical protein
MLDEADCLLRRANDRADTAPRRAYLRRELHVRPYPDDIDDAE